MQRAVVEFRLCVFLLPETVIVFHCHFSSVDVPLLFLQCHVSSGMFPLSVSIRLLWSAQGHPQRDVVEVGLLYLFYQNHWYKSLI